jgi:hypothetical protein
MQALIKNARVAGITVKRSVTMKSIRNCVVAASTISKARANNVATPDDAWYRS